MAPRKLDFVKNGEEEDDNDDQQTLDKADEDLSGEEGAAPLPPKKTKFGAARERVGSEPGENGSACSSPSASGFIVMPAVKPSGKKKTPSTKIFSDADEIALLKGLAVFWADGRNNKWIEFHHFIKDDLTNQFSKIQVSEKIRNLKKKFETIFERARGSGGHIDFLDSHETIVFELSKVLWGGKEGIAEESRKGAENEDEEANKILRKRKEVDEHSGVKKKKRKRKQVNEHGEESKILEQEKDLDEHHEENNLPEKRKQVDEHDVRNKILIQREEVDDDHEENNIPEKQKQVDEQDEIMKILKQGKEVDGDNEENNTAEKGKQVIEISKEGFQSAFPLLYASFDTFGYPKIVKEKCTLIPQEKAQELEEKWRELRAEALRLELKKIDLMKRDLQDQLQRI